MLHCFIVPLLHCSTAKRMEAGFQQLNNETMKPLLLFDIDSTLLNTNQLREFFDKSFADSLTVELSRVTTAKDSYLAALEKSTDFNPDDYIRSFCKDFKVDKKALTRIYFEVLDLYRQSLYPETMTTLRKLQTVYRLGIFTEGFRKFQLTKLKNSGIFDLFDRKLIFIHRRKLTANIINYLPYRAFIVDDNPEVIEVLKKYPHVTPVWLNRKDQSKDPTAVTIHNLKEILSIF